MPRSAGGARGRRGSQAGRGAPADDGAFGSTAVYLPRYSSSSWSVGPPIGAGWSILKAGSVLSLSLS